MFREVSPNQQLKVCLFSTALLSYGGGAEKYMMELAVYLKKVGIDVEILTTNRRLSKIGSIPLSIFYLKVIKPESREKESEVKAKLGSVKWEEKSLWNLKKDLRNYDVIYSKNEIIDLLFLKMAGIKTLPPVVTGIHTPIFIPITKSFHTKFHNFLYLGPFYRWLLKGITAVHVYNSSDSKLLEEKFAIKAELFRHPFPVSNQVKEDNLESHPKDEQNLLFVGRLIEQKGIDVMIEVIDNLAGSELFGKMRFKIAGRGDDQEFPRLLTELSQKYPNVEYLGHVPNSKINSLYEWSDVVLVPSRYETVNYVVLEAGANARVVIASDIPGPKDTIKNGETGFLVKLSTGNFVRKIREVYKLKKENPEVFWNIGRKARERIALEFDPKKIYDKIIKSFYCASMK